MMNPNNDTLTAFEAIALYSLDPARPDLLNQATLIMEALEKNLNALLPHMEDERIEVAFGMRELATAMLTDRGLEGAIMSAEYFVSAHSADHPYC